MPEVAGHIAQHIGELQRLAEADAELPHGRQIPAPEPRSVRPVHVGPELPHAACDQVGVAVQVLVGLECGELALVLARKQAQVLRHAFDDRLDDGAHAIPVLPGECPVGRQAVGEPLEQLALGRQRPGAGGGDDVGEPLGLRPGHLCPERLQVGDPGAAFDETRVGDRVGRAREEVGEPYGGPDGGRQDGQRDIEGAADPFQQGGGEIASGHGR